MAQKSNSLFFSLSALISVLVGCVPVLRAQNEPKKIELGGQVSIVRLRDPFFRPGFLITEVTYTTELGVGTRFTYNLNRNFSLDSEINIFPRNTGEFRGGRKLQGVIGLKAGQRGDRVGIFGKVRPGFIRFASEEVTTSRPATDFILDIGGVFEAYPSRRTILRFDLGDTVIRRNVVDRTPLPPGLSILKSIEVTSHNLQFSVGISFRF